MRRPLLLTAVLLSVFCVSGLRATAAHGQIITQATARQHGLTRAWFTQIQMDRALSRVRHLVLHDGVLYVQTNRAMIHAVDSETGRTLWAQQVGTPNHPSLPAGVNSDFIAVINGSVLYVLNRYNGKLLWRSEVSGAPGGGAALSEKRAYVPMVDGLVAAYRLDPVLDPLKELGKVDEKQKPKKEPLTEEQKTANEAERREALRIHQEWIPPLMCQSFGRAMVQPIVMRQDENEELVAWPTNRGLLFVGRINRREEDKFTVRFRLETGATISCQPAYLPPMPEIGDGKSGVIVATSEDGYVYAVLEEDGSNLWRFSTAEPMIEPPIAIGKRVYVTIQPGGMYCLSAENGGEIWWSPGVTQFIAASAERVYAADKLGRILVLSAASGTRLDTIPAYSLPIRLANIQTDRIYLATETGLIQCLHEIELREPIQHRQLAVAGEEKAKVEQKGMDEAAGKKKPGKKEAEKKPDDKPNPFGGGAEEDEKKGEKKADDPFGMGGDNPFGDGKKEEAAPDAEPKADKKADDPFG